MFKVGDYVTRKSHNNDMVFKISSINGDIAKLSGFRIRLIADANINDLVLYNDIHKSRSEVLINNDNSLKGLVLHIDGDCDYLKECIEFYQKNNIPVIGYCINEENMPNVVLYLLKKHKPDILVLTGHDGFKNGKYINSLYYTKAIIEARSFDRSRDGLIIIGGGCQSEYQALIKNGANFASSPKGVVIDVLDPAIVAAYVSSGEVDSYLDIKSILDKTMNKSDGIGGIDTKGTARKVY